MTRPTFCPQCQRAGLVITQSPRVCDCPACGYHCWLSQLSARASEFKKIIYCPLIHETVNKKDCDPCEMCG